MKYRDPVASALAFIEAYFPECDVAFLAGSVVRGEATATSDLDIVVLTGREAAPYRESFLWEGWPIEVFVHNEPSLFDYFDRGAMPILQQMCVESIVLRDRDGTTAKRVKEEARRRLDAGPEPLAAEELDALRYSVTNILDDFSGSTSEGEDYFIAQELASECVRLVLLTNRRWLGHGKWTLRALRRFDPFLADQLTAALTEFYKSGDKVGLSAFAEAALLPVGGRLFEGYKASPKGK